MSWTQKDLDDLDAAIATGAMRVRYADGRETVFRNLADMTTTRNRIAAELGVTPSPTASRVMILEHRR